MAGTQPLEGLMFSPSTRWTGRAAALAPLVVFASLLAVSPSRAQTSPAPPKVFYACYNKGTGTVYRIKEPNTPQSCSSSQHVEFSWTDGIAGNDHGALSGLSDDDHPQYLLANGTRALTGSLSLGGFKLTNLGAASANGDALRFEQGLKVGDAAAGDLGGTYPSPFIAALRGSPLSATAPSAAGQVLAWDGGAWTPALLPAGITDHGALGGLGDDDHPQYLLADGTRSPTGNLGMGGFKLTGLAAATANGDALRFEQGIKAGDAAGGDLGGTYPNASVVKLQGRSVSNAAPSAGQVLTWNGGSVRWEPATPASGGGISGWERVDQPTTVTLVPGSLQTLIPTCPAGKKAVGGGFSSGGGISVLNSFPFSSSQWLVDIKNTLAIDLPAGSAHAYVVCVTG
jgi:hypothetical protein